MTFITSTANQQDFSKETSLEEPIVAPFVQKTFDLVSDPSTDHIISWSPDGKTFFIHQLHLLQLEILPQYFKHNNACSFIRQLNTYGFRKVIKSTARRPSSSAPDRIEFGHPFFYKEGASKLVLIVRKKSKKRKLSEMEDSGSSCQFSRSCDDVEDLLLRPINNKEVAEEVKQLKQDNQVLAKALLTLSKDHQSTLQLLSKLSQEIDSLKTSLAGNSPNSFHSSYDSESDTEHEESVLPPAKRQKLSTEQSFLDTFSNPTSLPRSILDFAPFDLQQSAESFDSESSSSAASPEEASFVENYSDQAFPVPGFSYLCKMDYSENSGQVGGYCSVPIM